MHSCTIGKMLTVALHDGGPLMWLTRSIRHAASARKPTTTSISQQGKQIMDHSHS